MAVILPRGSTSRQGCTSVGQYDQRNAAPARPPTAATFAQATFQGTVEGPTGNGCSAESGEAAVPRSRFSTSCPGRFAIPSTPGLLISTYKSIRNRNLVCQRIKSLAVCLRKHILPERADSRGSLSWTPNRPILIELVNKWKVLHKSM